jgi:hypothetical protein
MVIRPKFESFEGKLEKRKEGSCLQGRSASKSIEADRNTHETMKRLAQQCSIGRTYAQEVTVKASFTSALTTYITMMQLRQNKSPFRSSATLPLLKSNHARRLPDRISDLLN